MYSYDPVSGIVTEPDGTKKQATVDAGHLGGTSAPGGPTPTGNAPPTNSLGGGAAANAALAVGASLPGGGTRPSGDLAQIAGTAPLTVSLPPEVVAYLRTIADNTQQTNAHLQAMATASGPSTLSPGGGLLMPHPTAPQYGNGGTSGFRGTYTPPAGGGAATEITTAKGSVYATSPSLPAAGDNIDGVFVNPRNRIV
jgi:hypothetical protein